MFVSRPLRSFVRSEEEEETDGGDCTRWWWQAVSDFSKTAATMMMITNGERRGELDLRYDEKREGDEKVEEGPENSRIESAVAAATERMRYRVPAKFLKTYTTEELEHLKSTFKEIDQDRSGQIDRDELKMLFEALDEPVDESTLISFMREFDADGDGGLSFGEFLEIFERKRDGDPQMQHFTNLVAKMNTTPTCALEKECRRRNLKVAYRLVGEREEELSKVYEFVCMLTGDFSSIVDGNIVTTRESRKYFGCGVSTRIARFQAAARALTKIRKLIPGASVRPGDIPRDWVEWGIQNLNRGVPPEQICRTLVAKGFFPSRNATFMQTLLVVSLYRQARDLRPEIRIRREERFLPQYWSQWARDLIAKGFRGSVVLQILERAGYNPRKDPKFTQDIESNRFLYEQRPYAVEGRDAAFDFRAAVYADDVYSQKIYVAAGQDVNASLSGPDGMRCPALIIGVRRNLARTTKWLLSSGADVNRSDQFDRTALYYAVEQNNTTIIERLLDAGARFTVLDAYKNSVLHAAAIRGNHEALGLLLRFGTTKLRDFYSSKSFENEMIALFNETLKKRLSSYERQRFKKEWILPTIKSYYGTVVRGPKSELNAIARDILLPPQDFVIRHAIHHYDQEPDVEFIEVKQYVTIVGHVVRENLVNWKNRAGKTPLCLAVCPDGPFQLRHQETCRLLIDDFGAYVGDVAVDRSDKQIEQNLALHYVRRRRHAFERDTDFEHEIMTAPPSYVVRPWYWLLRRSIFLSSIAGWEERLHPRTGRRFFVSLRAGMKNDIYYGAAGDDRELITDGNVEDGAMKTKENETVSKDHRVVWEKPDAVLEFEGAAGGKGSKHRWQYRLRHAFEVRTVSVWRELKFRDEPVFYYNIFTKKCQYDIPPEIEDLEHVEQLDGEKSKVDAIEASLNTGLIRRGRQKKKRIKERKSSPYVADKVGKWEEVWDPIKGSFFFRDTETDEIASCKPVAFVRDAEQLESALSYAPDVSPPYLRGRHHAVLSIIRGAKARAANMYCLCEWGCGGWMPQGETMRNHEKEECMMRITSCNFNCSLKMQAREWIHKRAGHEKVCPRRLVDCPQHCGEKIVFEELDEHCKNTCPKRPFPLLRCKYNCGMTFKGSWDMHEHIETEKLVHETEGCPERVVRCTWSGCMLEVKAKDMRAHRRKHLNEIGVKTWTMAGVYTYTVPLNQKALKIQMWGGGGGAGHLRGQRHAPGFGGSFVECVIDVYPGETLTVTVGEGGAKGIHGEAQQGQTHNLVKPGIAAGGRPGGGSGCASYVQWACGGGGGFTCIQRNTPKGGLELVALAAGGGGGAHPLFTDETGGRDGSSEKGGDGGGYKTRIVDDVHATGLGESGVALQGGNGRILGAGGGGGFFGGGAGGFMPGFVGCGGHGSNFVYEARARNIVSLHASDMAPPGKDRDPPIARGAFVWDVLGDCVGTGGRSGPEKLSDGCCGAVRIICRQSRRGKWWL